MIKFTRPVICCLTVFLFFWSMGFASELSLFTIVFCSIAFGYGLNMIWNLYRKFQMNISTFEE